MTSVVDRFLEHSRVFAFGPPGRSRGVPVERRLDAAQLPAPHRGDVPGRGPGAAARLLDEVLGVGLRDNVKAGELQPDGTYLPVRSRGWADGPEPDASSSSARTGSSRGRRRSSATSPRRSRPCRPVRRCRRARHSVATDRRDSAPRRRHLALVRQPHALPRPHPRRRGGRARRPRRRERLRQVDADGDPRRRAAAGLGRAAAPARGPVTYLPQEPEFPPGATVAGELAVAQAPLREALEAHARARARSWRRRATRRPAAASSSPTLADRIEQLGGWDTEHHARTLLDRLGVKEWDRPVAELSGGTAQAGGDRARAARRGRTCCCSTSPTNHLDADTVEWLEEELDELERRAAARHARPLLPRRPRRPHRRDRSPAAALTSYPGNYEAYLEQKLEAEEDAASAAAQARAVDRPGGRVAAAAAPRRGAPRARRASSARAEADGGARLPAAARSRELQIGRRRRGSAHTVIEAEHVDEVASAAREVLQRRDAHRPAGRAHRHRRARTARARRRCCACCSASCRRTRARW